MYFLWELEINYVQFAAKLAEKTQNQKEHKCYKNWEKSFSSMEQNTLVEGFSESEKTHGLRCFEFIGDGDSSTLSNLKNKVPNHGYAIRKIECVNHSLKNYRKHLHEIANNNKNLSSKKFWTHLNIKMLTAAAIATIANESKKVLCYKSKKVLCKKSKKVLCVSAHSLREERIPSWANEVLFVIEP